MKDHAFLPAQLVNSLIIKLVLAIIVIVLAQLVLDLPLIYAEDAMKVIYLKRRLALQVALMENISWEENV